MWSSNAEQLIHNQIPPVSRITFNELENAHVDWGKLDRLIFGKKAHGLSRIPKKHQEEAISKALDHYKNHNRGRLIMACGTGKTFTSLKIAEHLANETNLVLFLVPSIALLGQILLEWTSYSKRVINSICVCSDPKVSKRSEKDSTLTRITDLALPASTNIEKILHQFKQFYSRNGESLTVVFSTYQSIDVVSKSQKRWLEWDSEAIFDLIVCDEAHRTTGATFSKEDESAFVKVHNNEFIKSRKRLYMTATPRLYSDSAKQKAEESDILLCSMDDDKLYGKEFYRIGFGRAVEEKQLTDYKVLILTLDKTSVHRYVQNMKEDDQLEIKIDDAAKLIGCINALSKQTIGDKGNVIKVDTGPMKRAVAFCSRVSDSEIITKAFNSTKEHYINNLPEDLKGKVIQVESKHIDGTQSALDRNIKLNWLKKESEKADDKCKILTNVKCLSEGVDVPTLDAVLFLSPRNSQIDVVQSVGRVMRTSKGKKYGYIIIPVVVPFDAVASEALNKSKEFKVVWSVLNALRAHDDRFNATINKIQFNKKRPENIVIIPGHLPYDDGTEHGETNGKHTIPQNQLPFNFDDLQDTIYAKLVEKVGDRVYWEKWAKDVAEIQKEQVSLIESLIKDPSKKPKFDDFVESLRQSINPGISEQDTVDFLSQHILTQPVFDALFEDYTFSDHNSVSNSIESFINRLDEDSKFQKDERLKSFYDSIRKRVEGIDNSEGKQKIIKELYEKFFQNALPKLSQQLGIVYTPIEIVDFVIQSVNDLMIKEFEHGLTKKDVHILDPFTGTGSFITRLFQIGIIKEKDLIRKYQNEIHANEIVLLAHYISDVNIESAFKEYANLEEYLSFDGAVLTDTFQLGETEELMPNLFPENSERINQQKEAPMVAIIGNPPYSGGQKSANDDAQNQQYLKLENNIRNTYFKQTTDAHKQKLDSYIKAFRWASDRINNEKGGIIGFVTNGSWLDSVSGQGFRRSIEQEFSSIYVFNLRGDARTSGEKRRKEKDNVFDQGARTSVCITFLVRKPNYEGRAIIYYKDIGDYLKREEKLKKIEDFKSILNPKMGLTKIKPNKKGDWINQRKDFPDYFIPLTPSKKFDSNSRSFFVANSNGVVSSRDAWVVNFSKNKLKENVCKTINYYNDERIKLNNVPAFKRKSQVNINHKLGKWGRDDLDRCLQKGIEIKEDKESYRITSYRPFTKSNRYFNNHLNNNLFQNPRLFPNKNSKNLVICIPGRGIKNETSVLITNSITDYSFLGGHCYPLYVNQNQFDNHSLCIEPELYDGISDWIHEKTIDKIRNPVTKKDIFNYVYGFLHSPDYKNIFSETLKKELPKIPLLDEDLFWKYSNAGRKLAELHLNYENVPPYPNLTISGLDVGNFRVEKMKFQKNDDKSSIIYNNSITIDNIPSKAFQYIINGRSAVEWIMDRYQVRLDSKSGIINDPNDWSVEQDKPRYILNLLLSVISVSVQTVDIVDSLPQLEFD